MDLKNPQHAVLIHLRTSNIARYCSSQVINSTQHLGGPSVWDGLVVNLRQEGEQPLAQQGGFKAFAKPSRKLLQPQIEDGKREWCTIGISFSCSFPFLFHFPFPFLSCSFLFNSSFPFLCIFPFRFFSVSFPFSFSCSFLFFSLSLPFAVWFPFASLPFSFKGKGKEPKDSKEKKTQNANLEGTRLV